MLKYSLVAVLMVGSAALVGFPRPCCPVGSGPTQGRIDNSGDPLATVTFHVLGLKKTKSGAT